MYKKAREGKIKNFTGIDDKYDVPKNPEIVVDSKNQNLDEDVKHVINYLRTKKFMT